MKKKAWLILLVLSIPLLGFALYSSVTEYPSATAPKTLWDKSEGQFSQTYEKGFVTVNTANSYVAIEWSAAADYALPVPAESEWQPLAHGLEDDPSPAQYQLQQFSTSFHPTNAEVVDNDTLLVAGFSSTGTTILEKWTFAWPLQMPFPQADPSTGISTVPVVVPPRTETTVLYKQDVTGRRFVRGLSAQKRSSGAPTSAIVWFNDSRDLYEINLSSGQLSLLASPGSQQGALGQIPELTNLYDRISSSEMIGGPYYYFFGRTDWTYSASSAQSILVFEDSDKDGSLDTHLMITPAQWTADGWSNAYNFVMDD